jgi:tricorn protease
VRSGKLTYGNQLIMSLLKWTSIILYLVGLPVNLANQVLGPLIDEGVGTVSAQLESRVELLIGHVPADELRENFLDAWRLHRDYFYDPHMHGVNWSAMRDRYLELAGRVHDGQELNDVIAQMVSELSMLHTFVFGGDLRRGTDQIQLGSLGARLKRE